MLLALSRFFYLSTGQVIRLLYRESTASYARGHLKELYHGGFVERLWLPKPTPYGSPTTVYCLTSKGHAFIKREMGETSPRFRGREEAQKGLFFLEHTRATNDFLILAELATRGGHLRLARVLHERQLKREPIYVPNGRARIAVVPDAWLDLRDPDGFQHALAVEIDRGTMAERPYARKVKGYLGASRGPYQKVFGTPSLTVLVATTAGYSRLEHLLHWTEKAIKEHGQPKEADLFRLAALDLATLRPESLFLGALWLKPFSDVRYALIS